GAFLGHVPLFFELFDVPGRTPLASSRFSEPLLPFRRRTRGPKTAGRLFLGHPCGVGAALLAPSDQSEAMSSASLTAGDVTIQRRSQTWHSQSFVRPLWLLQNRLALHRTALSLLANSFCPIAGPQRQR